MAIVTHLLNGLINSVSVVLTAILALLPESPFTFDLSAGSSFMQLFFWLVPVPGILSVLAVYLPAVGVYYGLRVLMRYINLAGG